MAAGHPTLRALTRPEMLGFHLLAIAAVAAMTVAGIWQLGVFTDARSQAALDRSGAAPVPLSEIFGPDDAFPIGDTSRRVTVTGRYAARDSQFLVKGQRLAGTTGYWVVSPLLPSSATGGGSALLVVRGWEADPTLPDVPAGAVTVTGTLQPGMQDRTSVTGDRTVTSLTISALVARVPFDLYSGYLLRDAELPAPADHLAVVPAPQTVVSWTTGLRNLVYAVQWWVFAGFALFAWVHICRDVVQRERRPTPRLPTPVP